jgi:WD40 repeat protein
LHVQVLDAETKTVVKTFKGHTKELTSVGFSNAQHIMSASADGTVRLWNLDGQEVRRIGVGEPVERVFETPDGRRMVIIARDPTPHFLVFFAKALDLETGGELRTFKFRAEISGHRAALAGKEKVSGPFFSPALRS